MRVAIVGSGLGGLLTSAALRRGGVDVVRFEKAEHDGGRARSPALGGVAMNLGPRAIYRGLALDRALARFGITPRGFVPPARAFGVLDDEVVELPGTVAKLVRAPFLDARDKRTLALAMARLTVGALDARPGARLGDWLDRHAAAPRVRALVMTLVRTATYVDDEDLDARLALSQVRAALTRGVLYVDDGWRAIVDALQPHAGPSTPRTIARLDDIDADAVVTALPIDDARRLLFLPALPGPATASCLDVILERLPRPDRRVVLGVGQPVYCSVHTAPGVPGPLRVHAMKYGSGSRTELEHLLDLVQPGWRDVALASRYLSRMVVTSSRARFDRTPVDVTRDARHLVVGDWVDSGALLADGVAASAMHAADSMLRRARGLAA